MSTTRGETKRPTRDRASPVPVTVVTGFLGAGKTTLVNRWLADVPRGDVSVIVNEIGTAGIDGELLAGRARELVEITGGCVCCSTQQELVRALDELAARGTARILVETSGAASPAGVIRAVSGGKAGAFGLDGIVTVVDASRIEVLASQDLAIEQLGYADVVVLSHADRCAREVLAHAADLVGACNGAALVAETPSTETLATLLERRAADFAPPRGPPASRHPVYESASLLLDGEVDGERLADFMETDLARLAGRIFRIKGILAVREADERVIVQGVTDRVAVTFGAPWGPTRRTSRLVVVGFGLARDALERGFAACAADADEL
jgi:G3E family GTPase